MANKSVSIDHINQFIIHNFIPYAWAEMWETTMDSKLGDFKFVMCIRPNIIERTEWRSEDSTSYRIRSTNSFEMPPPEYYSAYCLELPMIRGYVVGKWGKPLDQDSDRKENYVAHMIRNIRLASPSLMV